MNPFYPVKPCPYKDPSKAPLHMRFVTDNGNKFLIDHVQHELAWIRKIGKCIKYIQSSKQKQKPFITLKKYEKTLELPSFLSGSYGLRMT